MRTLTNIIETPLQAFLEDADERGRITSDELESFALEYDVDAEELAELRAELEAREIEIEGALGVEADGSRVPANLEAGEVRGTPDSLTLFMNAAGRHPLLTAA